MNEWWGGLGLLNRVMFGGAAFFSVLFIWQLISAFLGLSDESVDIDDISDDGYDAQTGEDASETIEAFKLLGVRSGARQICWEEVMRPETKHCSNHRRDGF